MRRLTPLRRIKLGLLLAVASFGIGTAALALDVSVSATVADLTAPPPNPVVQFRGRASPNVTLTLIRDGATVATASADGEAKFDVTLSDQPIGQHTFEISAQDANGLSHASFVVALNLTAGSTTIINGIFLGPSITVQDPEVKLGEPLNFSGMTAPNSAVTLTLNSTPRSYAITAGANGQWSRTVDSAEVGTGSHQATALALAPDSTISEGSPTVAFSVNPLEPCDGKTRSDLNCDGRVNLTDFSILLFFWLVTNPSNDRADINNDNQVTITDFSIMLFQWTD